MSNAKTFLQGCGEKKWNTKRCGEEDINDRLKVVLCPICSAKAQTYADCLNKRLEILEKINSKENLYDKEFIENQISEDKSELKELEKGGFR